MTRALIILACMTLTAWGQAPAVSSFVDSASYQPTIGQYGAIASVFGTSLATTTAFAQSVPLRLQLGGTSVTVGGVAAPLFYVSPTQINLLVPAGYGTIVVSTAAGSSAPYDSETAASAYNPTPGGIFTSNGSGCGQGAILNVAADGGLSINSAANSASPGNWIAIYGSNLTDFYTSVTDQVFNVPAPSNPPLSSFFDPDDALFDLSIYSGAGWTGLAPGYVGLDQVNVPIPTSVREGCAVPLQLAYMPDYYVVSSQPVTVAIHDGGGQCVDPPANGYGQITWQKTTLTTASNVTTETDTVTASLQASPGQQAPPAPVYTEYPVGYLTSTGANAPLGPPCLIPGYRSLGAGSLTARGPGFGPTQMPVVPLQQGYVSGLSTYQATLPAGTIQPGTFTLAAAGGQDVAAFQAAVQLPADIQVQAPLAGVNVTCPSFTVNWSGGDPNSWVTVILFMFVFQTRASTGTALFGFPDFFYSQSPISYPLEIYVEVDPDPSAITPFSASGLSLGGRATWQYLHVFEANLVH